LKNPTLIIFISIFASLILISCSDNSVNNGYSDHELLYSADEIVCDYNDSTTIQFDTAIYPVYMKTLFVHVSDRSFSKVKITGTVDTFYTHDEMAGQNPVMIMGVIYDSVNQYVGDSLTFYFRHKGDFLNITPVTYPENEPYLIVFAMQVSDPARGDFIRVKNLRIYKSN
jgi:hypothetical protein